MSKKPKVKPKARAKRSRAIAEARLPCDKTDDFSWWPIIKFVIFIGVVSYAMLVIIPQANDAWDEHRASKPPRVNLVRTGTVEHVRLFQSGWWDDRTLVEFTDERDLLLYGHYPLPEGVRYDIVYSAYPYQTNDAVPLEHACSVRAYGVAFEASE